MKLQHREVWQIALLAIVTCGIYLIYWLVKTKCELNESGATIPSAWLLVIPLVQIYFLYTFAQGYCRIVFGNDEQSVAYFLLLFFLLPIGVLIMQSRINALI